MVLAVVLATVLDPHRWEHGHRAQCRDPYLVVLHHPLVDIRRAPA
jgi:hypothetical protein